MKAIIVKPNYQRGMYIFQREDGEYGYLEVLDTVELETEDIVTGDFTVLGGTTIIKSSTSEELDIYIQDYCSLQLAYDMVFNN